MVLRVPVDPKLKVDPMFKKIISSSIDAVRNKNDDVTFFYTGLTGSGKSSLACFAYEYFAQMSPGLEMTTSVVGFTMSQYAEALKYNKNNFKKGFRFSWNDEANITKHSVMTKENKALIDLKFSIRGMGFIDNWCNPSADILQKEIIEELIKGLFFVYTKNSDGSPRKYMFFTKDKLLAFLEKYKNLKTQTLLKYGESNSSYVGWFHRYDSAFWREYEIKKDSRMEDKIDAFADKFGVGDRDYMTASGVAKILRVVDNTVREYFAEAKEKDLVEEGVHFDMRGINTIYYQDIVPVLKEIQRDRSIRRNKFNEVHVSKDEDNDKSVSNKLSGVKKNIEGAISNLNLDLVN